MDARILELPFDVRALQGLSEPQLRSHHQNAYAGAVRRLNAVRAQLRGLALDAVPGLQREGLKREELLATHSMRLHELYFDSLGGAGAPMAAAWELALRADFGSLARWQGEFVARAKARAAGEGWMLLVFQGRTGTLENHWSTDDGAALAPGVPVLALDLHEHAYRIDFGAAAERYVDAFMHNIHWGRVHARYQQAVEQASAGCGAALEEVPGALCLDVRRSAVYEQSGVLIPGARWLDPEAIGSWAAQLPAERELIVYCAHGHEVSQAAALKLRAGGLRARYLRGGIEAWQAAGRPLQRPAGRP